MPPSGLCDNIDCIATTVNVNGVDYNFQRTTFLDYGFIPNTGTLELLSERIVAGSSAFESLQINIDSVQIGKHLLVTPQSIGFAVFHSVISENHVTLEQSVLVDNYNNWVKITELCDGSIKGTAHFQLSLASGWKSVMYNKADTLNFHFDFSACPN